MNIIQIIYFNLAYLRNPPWDTGISPPELFDFIKANPSGKALDLGCGTGTNIITLAKNDWCVTGIDVVPLAILQAHKKIKSANVTAKLHIADITKLVNLQEEFDLILDIGCYHSINQRFVPHYLNNIKRFLKIGGTYLLYGFTNRRLDSTGLTDVHLDALGKFLKLIERKNGKDRGRSAAWFKFIKC